MEQTQVLTTKHIVKQDASRTGWAVLLYAFISMTISIVWMIGESMVRYGFRVEGITDTAEQDRIFDAVMTEVCDDSGTYLIVGVLVGLVFLFLYFHKSGIAKTMFRTEQKMTPARFAGLACVFFGGQLLFQGAYELLEAGLNLIGFTAESSMELATSSSQTVSMFLYAGIIGPIAEELVYRGFVMRALERHGKVLAILVSSILFGVMHGNLPQSLFAFCVGLVLGYVAIEYSLIWSIVLHILNNLVLADLMSMALEGCSAQVQNIVSYSVLGVFFVLGLIVVIRSRTALLTWIRENMWEKPRMRWVMTTVAMLLFVGLHLLMAVAMLEKL